MPKYKAEWSDGEIVVPLKYRVEGDGVITDFEPEPLKTRLYGAAYLAHVNFRNALDGCLTTIPTRVKVLHVIE